MTHYFEKNIVEIKNEYTECLCNILIPLIYEGIKALYKSAIVINEKLEVASRIDPNVKNPGLPKIFQGCLKDIPTLNRTMIEREANRIREASKCSDWFDDLLKSVVKSYIILLTFNSSGKKCKLVSEKYHDRVDTCEFIHKCYVECARIFFNNPELFYVGYEDKEMVRNMNESHKHIKIAITEAIKKILPTKLILQEYLSNDYIEEDMMVMPIGKEETKRQFVYVPHNERTMYDDNIKRNVNKVGLLESTDTTKSHSESHKKKDLLENDTNSMHSNYSHHSSHKKIDMIGHGETHPKENHSDATLKRNHSDSKHNKSDMKRSVKSSPNIPNKLLPINQNPLQSYQSQIPINLPIEPVIEPVIKPTPIQTINQTFQPQINEQPIDKPLGGIEHLTNKGLENFMINDNTLNNQKINEQEKDNFFDQYINNDII